MLELTRTVRSILGLQSGLFGFPTTSLCFFFMVALGRRSFRRRWLYLASCPRQSPGPSLLIVVQIVCTVNSLFANVHNFTAAREAETSFSSLPCEIVFLLVDHGRSKKFLTRPLQSMSAVFPSTLLGRGVCETARYRLETPAHRQFLHTTNGLCGIKGRLHEILLLDATAPNSSAAVVP
jgi:hypothetical protein